MASPTQFHCGEAICKKPIPLDSSQPIRWPVRCPACRVSLYPRDVIDSTPLDGLAPNRSVLKRSVGGKLVEVTSRDLGGSGGGAALSPALLAAAAVLALVGLGALAWFLLR